MEEKRTKNHDVVKAIQDLKNSRIKDLRHDRILIISRLMAIFALVLLIFIRLFSNGTTELTSINGFSVINKSINSQEVAIVPLATPLLVGPGTMTTLIVLTGTQNLINVLVGGMVATIYVFLALRYADKITTLIGRNGLMAVSRLMAIILAA